MTIGERIKEARLSKQMTQQELVGEYITRNMLSKIENGSAKPSVGTLEYLASALGLPPGSFLSDTPELPPPNLDKIDILRQMLDENNPEFEQALQEAKQEWTEMGLALLDLEFKYNTLKK